MAGIDRLIFHIGVPKTGSSLLQKALRNLRSDLQERGVTYIDRNVFMSIPSYKAWAPYGRPGYSKREFLTEFASKVDRRRRRGDAAATTTVLISNETGAGRARDFGDPFWPGAAPGITEIIETLEPASTELVMFVRRQDRLLESFYMQRIHRGGWVDWQEHRDTICRDDRVDFTELVESIENLPTVTGVRIRPFEIIQAGAPAFVSDFLGIIDATDLVHRLRPELLDPTNPSFTQTAWEAAMILNPMLDRPDQPKKVRKFLNSLFPADNHPKAQLLTDDERAELLEQYRPRNEQFFDLRLPDFPREAYSTADGTRALRTWLDPVTLGETGS
jgi:hypothetical protein